MIESAKMSVWNEWSSIKRRGEKLTITKMQNIVGRMTLQNNSDEEYAATRATTLQGWSAELRHAGPLANGPEQSRHDSAVRQLRDINRAIGEHKRDIAELNKLIKYCKHIGTPEGVPSELLVAIEERRAIAQGKAALTPKPPVPVESSRPALPDITSYAQASCWSEPPPQQMSVTEDIDTSRPVTPRLAVFASNWEDAADGEGIKPARDVMADRLYDLARFQNIVATAIDGGHRVCNEFHAGAYMSPDQALAEHDHIVGDAMTALFHKLRKKYEMVPTMLTALQEEISYFDRAHTCQAALLRGRTPNFDFGKWERVQQEQDFSKATLNTTQLQEKLLSEIQVSFPFTSEKPAFAQVASHPVMNATRIVASTFTYMSAAKRARVWAERHQAKHAVVIDVGAGSFGAERLTMLKGDNRNASIFVHAMIPIEDTADVARWTRNLRSEAFLSWNNVGETGIVNRERFNYCHHLARDCTCMAMYDHVEAVAIHSAYYFNEADFRNICTQAQSVECALHIPVLGQTLPLQAPEYKWEDGAQVGSLLQRARAKATKWFTGVDEVLLQPLRLAGRTYRHQDIGQIVANGGFHTSHQTAALAAQHETLGCIAKLYGGVMCKATAAAFATSIVFPGPPVMKVVGAVATGVMAVAATAITSRALLKSRYCAEPAPYFDATIVATVKASYELEATREDMVHVITFSKEAPTVLTPNPTTSVTVNQDGLSRTMQQLMLAPDTMAARCQAAALLLRERVPVNQVRDTVQHAYHLTKNYLRRGDLDRPVPPRLPDLHLVSIYQASALVCLQICLWTAVAVSRQQQGKLGAIATLVGRPTCTGVLWTLLSVCLPLTLGVWWVVWGRQDPAPLGAALGCPAC